MSEKKPGFNPEQPVPEIKILTDEQAEEVKKLFERLFEAYFSGVELKTITKTNQQIKAQRFNQLVSLLDQGFQYLTKEEKTYLKEKMAEKVNLNATPETDEKKPKKPNSETTGTTLPPPFKEFVPSKPEAAADELEFALSPDQLFNELKTASGCKMTNEQLLKSLLGNVRQLFKGAIDLNELKFTKIEPKENNFLFVTRVVFGGKRESYLGTTVTFYPVTRGVPGKQIKDAAPKWFMMPLKK